MRLYDLSCMCDEQVGYEDEELKLVRRHKTQPTSCYDEIFRGS